MADLAIWSARESRRAPATRLRARLRAPPAPLPEPSGHSRWAFCRPLFVLVASAEFSSRPLTRPLGLSSPTCGLLPQQDRQVLKQERASPRSAHRAECPGPSNDASCHASARGMKGLAAGSALSVARSEPRMGMHGWLLS